ncbi:MAG: dTDP-4-dehydrorhamnose reductase [Rhodothermales bacterium]|nr:dTDP-4-dehydrorhamnose reductase [Rhodothermales bacterium]
MLYQRILITGANGLLGQELVTALSPYPEFDILATGKDVEPRFSNGSCGYTRLDLTNTAEVRHLFNIFTPDVVINCAAMTAVDQCEDERDACWRVNVEAVEQMTRSCLNFSVKMVHLSTDFVFDGKGGPYIESQRPDPVNFYGKSKLAAENAIIKSGLGRWAIVRTVLVYGAGERLSRGNFVLWVIDKLSKGEEIQVVDDQWRTPTYAPDLAQGILRLVKFDKTGLYHLSGREYLSVYDFALKIAATFDLDASLIKRTNSASFSQRALRPLTTGFIILKAETEFGYKPHTIEQNLAHLGARLGLPVSTS